MKVSRTLGLSMAAIASFAAIAAPPPGKGGSSGPSGPVFEFSAQLAPTEELRVDDAVVDTGRLDIDFRVDGVPVGEPPVADSWDGDNRVGVVQVSARPSAAALVRNNLGGDCTASLPAADVELRADGYGIDGIVGDGVCDDQINGTEVLVVDIVAPDATGQPAYDVTGMYLTDFLADKNGESGTITFTDLDGLKSTYPFSWKRQTDPAVDNNEVFVSFEDPAAPDGGVIRFARAEISAVVGGFSVAGFEQTPIALVRDECLDSRGELGGCERLLAKGVTLDLAPAQFVPGDRGVTGVIYKDGVYRIEETRPYCLSGTGTPEPLPVDLGGPVDLSGNPIYEFVMRDHQCGFADVAGGTPFFYVLDINGSNLRVAEDTVEAFFEDEGAANGYACLSPNTDQRPAIGWLPNSRDPIPVLTPNIDGSLVVDKRIQDSTSGPCGSGRTSLSRFSYVTYHWVNAVRNDYADNSSGTFGARDMRDIVIERIDRLQFYVDQLFGCVQQGINQSTFSSDTGRIRQAFETANTDAKYLRAVALVNEMVGDVLDPRVNSEITAGACFFDRSARAYVSDTLETPREADWVDANAVGNLLSQLAHLRWMIYTNFVASPTQGIGASFDGDNVPADYFLE